MLVRCVVERDLIGARPAVAAGPCRARPLRGAVYATAFAIGIAGSDGDRVVGSVRWRR